jgi:hypothetical protein
MSIRMASSYTDTYDSSYRKYYVDEPSDTPPTP